MAAVRGGIHMQNGRAHYFAFISHKSKDSKFALQLQKFIETYNLPSQVRKRTNAPKRLTPICAYEMDFTSNPLLDEMTDKLQKSQYLIVLCSKELMKSGTKYINYEIETFIRLKKEEGKDPLKYIIPIILSGSFDDPEHDCCPEALKALGDNCPIALDRQKYKSDRELFLHAISGMLDIDYAVLQNRDSKRRRCQAAVLASVATLLLVLSIGALDYYVPKHRHYQDFVIQNGLPVGIGELSRGEYQRMNAHYVITEQQRKITQLTYVNAYGRMIDHENNWLNGDRPAKYVFTYADSELASVTYYKSSNIPLYVVQYSGASVADLKKPYDLSQPHYLNLNFESSLDGFFATDVIAHSGISRIIYEYDENGYVIKETYHADSSGRLVSSNDVFGKEYELDEKGRVHKEYFLDADGGHRQNMEGVFCKEYVYDEQNRLISYKNYDANGKLVANVDGVMHLVRTYDENHNIKTVELYDETGALLYVPAYNGAKQVQTYDDRGNRTLICFYDEKGEKAVILGFSATRFAYDKNGLEISCTYLDRDGNPTARTDIGVVEELKIRDDNGNPAEMRYCDADGNLVNSNDNYARVEYAYDERGLKIKEQYYDKNGNEANYGGYGYSVVTWDHDESGTECLRAYWNAAGEPVCIRNHPVEHGYHKREIVFTVSGNVGTWTIRHYDEQGRLVKRITPTEDRNAAVEEVVIQNGEITLIAKYDAEGRPSGAQTEIEYTSTAQGTRIKTLNQINEKGFLDITEISYYDARGVLVQEDKQIYYAESERVSEKVISYYHSSGMIDYVHEILYDQDGEVYKYFDGNGKIIRKESHGYRDVYRKQIVEYHEDGSITYTNNRHEGTEASSTLVHVDITKCDASGNVQYEYYMEIIDVCEEITVEYHKDGTITETYSRHAGADVGSPVVNKEITKYDSSGNIISVQKPKI